MTIFKLHSYTQTFILTFECVYAQSLKWACGSQPNSANNFMSYLRGPGLPWGSWVKGVVGGCLRSALNPRENPPWAARCATGLRTNKQKDFKLVRVMRRLYLWCSLQDDAPK